MSIKKRNRLIKVLFESWC